MVKYAIQLPHAVSGKELLDALRTATKKIKWHYTEETDNVSVTYGSVRIMPTKKTASIHSSFFGRGATAYSVALDNQYANLELNSALGLTDKNLEKLATALHDTILNSKPIKS